MLKFLFSFVKIYMKFISLAFFIFNNHYMFTHKKTSTKDSGGS